MSNLASKRTFHWRAPFYSKCQNLTLTQQFSIALNILLFVNYYPLWTFLGFSYNFLIVSLITAFFFFFFGHVSMFLEMLHWYFKERLEELSTIMAGEFDDDVEIQDNDDMSLDERSKGSYGAGKMEIDEYSVQGRFSENNKLVKNIGKVVRDLRNLGFTSMTEDAYASAIFLLLKVKFAPFLHFVAWLILSHFTSELCLICSFSNVFTTNIFQIILKFDLFHVSITTS